MKLKTLFKIIGGLILLLSLIAIGYTKYLAGEASVARKHLLWNRAISRDLTKISISILEPEAAVGTSQIVRVLKTIEMLISDAALDGDYTLMRHLKLARETANDLIIAKSTDSKNLLILQLRLRILESQTAARILVGKWDEINSDNFNNIIITIIFMVILFAIIVSAILYILYVRVIKPIDIFSSKIRNHEPGMTLRSGEASKILEIEGLYLSFEQMDDTLVNNFQVLKESKESVEKALADMEKANQDKEKYEQALRQAQKMEAVGQLTGGIAHDFNNMLGVIMGNLDLLRRNLVGDAKAAEYVEAAYKGSQRGADITKKLLSFSRGRGENPELTNVNDFITGMKDLIAKSLTPKITIETHLADDIWVVSIDPGEFENTLLNLSLNASDAMPGGGSLMIETSNKVLDEHYVQMNPGSTIGEYIQISISDTGTGMAPEVTGQVFQPFFTTKEVGQGTGLGLSMVYGFVQRSGGHIRVYSEPGRGSTFRIYLPKVTEGADENWRTKTKTDGNLTGGDETILILDDEEGLLKVATAYLEDLGYRVQTAGSPKQALQMLQEHDQIDLLFSDVVMPGGIDGYGLANEALKSCPDLKVLLTSGFTSKRENAINGDVAMFARLSENLLNKPYNQSELAVAVRSALDEDA